MTAFRDWQRRKGKNFALAARSAKARSLNTAHSLGCRFFLAPANSAFCAIFSPMELLIAYDRWCEGRVKALLLFLEEWLSIGQKLAERGMIVLYLVSIYGAPINGKNGLTVRICGMFTIGSLMWCLHRIPEALRECGNFMSKRRAVFRCCLQIVIADAIAFDLGVWMRTGHSGGAIAGQIVYAIFYYMVGIVSKGDRGRRRKLSWAKLKELFGTEWIPRPVILPQ